MSDNHPADVRSASPGDGRGWRIRDAVLDDPAELASVIGMLESLQEYVMSLDPIGRIVLGPGFGAQAWSELAGPVAEQQGRVLVIDAGAAEQSSSRVLVGLCVGFVCRPQTAADLLDVIPNRQGYLAKLFLAPCARSGGWGRRLVSMLEAHLVSCGCDNMWVDVNAFNPALGFYEELGFVPREIGALKAL